MKLTMPNGRVHDHIARFQNLSEICNLMVFLKDISDGLMRYKLYRGDEEISQSRCVIEMMGQPDVLINESERIYGYGKSLDLTLVEIFAVKTIVTYIKDEEIADGPKEFEFHGARITDELRSFTKNSSNPELYTLINTDRDNYRFSSMSVRAGGKGKVYRNSKNDDTLLDALKNHRDGYGAVGQSEIVIEYKFKYEHPESHTEGKQEQS